jgi:N,N'-diacetyllegionaminate synthase
MNKFYLFTETAFHHEGDRDYLISLVDETAKTGADGIKFQVLTKPTDFISTNHPSFNQLSSWCFQIKEWESIFSYTQKKGLDIILLPLNTEALLLTQLFDVKYVEVHSVCFNHLKLLEEIKKSQSNVILGIGGRNIKEIKETISFFGGLVKVLMVGFQSFPTSIGDIKLERIMYYKNRFPELIIGYADHSAYNDNFSIKSNEYSRILGASVFEKHITINEGIKRTDFESAVEGLKIKKIINALNFIENNILFPADKILKMTESELNYRNRQMRVVAHKLISAGKVLDYNDLTLKMTGNNEGFTTINSLIGKTTTVEIKVDKLLTQNDVT